METRRFVIKILRDFGFGKKTVEGLILDEATAVVDSLRTECGKALDTTERFNVPVLNTVWKLVAGEGLPPNDPKIAQLMHVLKL